MNTVKFSRMAYSDWSRFVEGGVSLNVKEDEYRRFAALCASLDLRWANGKTPAEWNPFYMYCHGSITVQNSADGITFSGADTEETKEVAPMEVKVNMENLSEDERDRLLALIEKANVPRVWPSPDDVVWAVNGSGAVFSNLLKKMKPQRLEYLKATNRLFRTQEEAEFSVEREKVLGELWALADWNGEEMEYFITISKSGEVSYTGMWTSFAVGAPHFKTKESLTAAVEKVGADRIRKYLSPVKSK